MRPHPGALTRNLQRALRRTSWAVLLKAVLPSVGYPSFHYRPAKLENRASTHEHFVHGVRAGTSGTVSAPCRSHRRRAYHRGAGIPPSPGNASGIHTFFGHCCPPRDTRSSSQPTASGCSKRSQTSCDCPKWTNRDARRSRPDGLALTPDEVGAWLFERRKRPNGSVVKEIPLDVASGTFPAGFNEVTAALYNNWAGIANLLAERGR